jgi:hypothetical protein
MLDDAMIKRLMTLQMISQTYEKLGGNLDDLTTPRIALAVGPLFEAAPVRTDAEKRASLEALFYDTVADILHAKEPAEEPAEAAEDCRAYFCDSCDEWVTVEIGTYAEDNDMCPSCWRAYQGG